MSNLVCPKHLAGLFAMYAVRQSPYIVPDNLAEAIVEFMAGFNCEKPAPKKKARYRLNSELFICIGGARGRNLCAG